MRRASLWSMVCLVVVFFVQGGCAGCEPELAEESNCWSDDDCYEEDTGGLAQDSGEGEDDVAEGPDAISCARDESACGSVCCTPGAECVEGACEMVCAGQLCGDEGQLCCEDSNICFGSACVLPGADCERTEQCGIDEICELSIGSCLPRDQIDVCEYRPPVGEFSPVVGCSWVPDGLPFANRGDIVATPVVANLTDDNGDGLTNTEDIPEIVFPSFDRNNQGCCNVDATLRIVSGACNADGTMNTIASISDPPINNDSGIAVADLDGDGVPEIIGVTNGPNGRPHGTVAFRRVTDDGSQWEQAWYNENFPAWRVHTNGGATVSVADLDGDGNPEVIIGNVVLNGQDGTLKWDGIETADGEGGIGNNAFLGPSSTVADINLDGFQEVIAGNTVYSHDGNPLWTFEYDSQNSTCQGPLTCDGFNAVARFTDTPEPNVVIVRQGEVFVLSHEGELVWKWAIPKSGCSRNEAGPPTVADFDGDGLPEIGTAGADFYVVAKMECDVDHWADLGCAERGILWKTPNNDCSSRATASSVFDFEGDGKAEVVYADEQNFRIFDGTTGDVLFEDGQHQSNTRIEMPVIADIDNSGSAAVLVASAYSNRGDRPGLRVWTDADNNWVRTRRIWNQHAYSVTNINEDGSVPAEPERNWENPRLNNFRQNVQPDGLFDAPDLVVRDVEFNELTCGEEMMLRVSFVVANEGAISVPAGVSVDLEMIRSGSATSLAELETTARLLPGNFESFEVEWEVPSSMIGSLFELRVMVDGDEDYNECDEENNEVLTQPTSCDISG